MSSIPRIRRDDYVSTTVKFGDSASNDAFSRLRTSNPATLFESSMEVDDQPLLWDDVTTGGGTLTYNMHQSSVTLAVPGASASAIRQSHE